MTTDKTTCDRFLDGRILLRQPARGYRAGMDPVFLAAASPARAGESVLDMGCGVGAALLCLAARVSGCLGMGLEIQPEMARLARENVEAHPDASGFVVEEGDVAHPPAAVLERRFDHVMANPPYFADGKTSTSPVESKARAHVLPSGDLSAWVRLAARVLKPRGSLTLIYPAAELAEALSVMGKSFGGLSVFPLWPHAGESAIRVLVQGRLGSRAPLRLFPGMVLHGADGVPTEEAAGILRAGAPILSLAGGGERR